jgi:hypothetical protein
MDESSDSLEDEFECAAETKVEKLKFGVWLFLSRACWGCNISAIVLF